MEITNRLNLPQPIVEAVKRDDYSKGEADFSVTQLTNPSLLNRLTRDHSDEITVDVADQIWLLFGKAVHAILEAAASDLADYVVETRKFINLGKWRISGKQDVYFPARKLIQDYKVTHSYSVTNPMKPAWSAQLNQLALLHRRHDHPVELLESVTFLKDHTKGAVRRGKFPFDAAVVKAAAACWTDDEVEAYMLERCLSHQQALDEPEVYNVTPCTREEMWAKPDTWAVKKKGGKRAVSGGIFNSKEEAEDFVAQQSGQFTIPGTTVKAKKKSDTFVIEHRPAVRTRCEDYCDVAKWCWCYQGWLKGQKEGV